MTLKCLWCGGAGCADDCSEELFGAERKMKRGVNRFSSFRELSAPCHGRSFVRGSREMVEWEGGQCGGQGRGVGGVSGCAGADVRQRIGFEEGFSR